MWTLTLLHRITSILLILSLIGECAVIPDFALEQAEKKGPDHKWDSVTRIKSRVGAKDTSSRDHLVNAIGKAGDSTKNLPSIADEKDEILKVEARAKAVRASLRSGREIEVVRSTNPPSVKSTAGHVGYEERHRFSGVRFDELLGPNEPAVEYKDSSSGGTFEFSDSEDEGSGSESGEDSDFEGEGEAGVSENQGAPKTDNISLERPEILLDSVINSGCDSDDDSDDSDDDLTVDEDESDFLDLYDSDEEVVDVPNIHWETSSKSKVFDLAKVETPSSKLTWSPSSEKKGASKPAVQVPETPVSKKPAVDFPSISAPVNAPDAHMDLPEEDVSDTDQPIPDQPANNMIHWKASSQTKALGVKPVKAEPVKERASEIHWKVSSQSKANAAVDAPNVHDEYEIRKRRIESSVDQDFDDVEKSVETASPIPVTLLHRERKTH